MEATDLITLGISSYAALLSTYIAFDHFHRRRPNVTFTHSFGKNTKGRYLSIIATNRSTSSIDIVKGEYFLGESHASRPIQFNKPASLESRKSFEFIVCLNHEMGYLLRVKEFHFISSAGKKFTYNLGRTILEDFDMNLFLTATPQIFHELEKSNRDYEKCMKEIDAKYQEMKDLLKDI